MSKSIIVPITCLECNTVRDCTVYTSINVSVNPELKKMFFKNEFNFFTCEKCDNKSLINSPYIYHDMDNEFQVWFTKGEPEDGWKETIKIAKRHFGPEHYMANPYILHNRMAATFMAALLENEGLPETKERREEYYEIVEGLVDIAQRRKKE